MVRVKQYLRRHALRFETSEPGIETKDVYIDRIRVGEYRVTFEPYDRAFIHWVGVRADYRGKGIGRQIVEKVLEDLRAQGIALVRLDASPEAIGFWEKMGFTAFDEKYDPDRPRYIEPMEALL